MHCTLFYGIALLLHGLADSLPSPLSTIASFDKRAFHPLPDDPELVNVTVTDLPDDFNATCGDEVFHKGSICKAVQWGVLLQDKSVFRGKKSPRKYPNGRFPHPNQDPDLPLNYVCEVNDDRMTYPLIHNGPYNGSPNTNTNWGPNRVVFHHEDGEIDRDGNPKAIFCGVIYHDIKGNGRLVVCN